MSDGWAGITGTAGHWLGISPLAASLCDLGFLTTWRSQCSWTSYMATDFPDEHSKKKEVDTASPLKLDPEPAECTQRHMEGQSKARSDLKECVIPSTF